jgi:hypothetical protein
MEGSYRPIFRTDAVRRYAESQQKAILPRIVCPRTFLCLWILLTLFALLRGAVLTWFGQVGLTSQAAERQAAVWPLSAWRGAVREIPSPPTKAPAVERR